MDILVVEQIQGLMGAKTIDEIESCIVKIVEMLEFDYFAYGVRINIPISAPKFEMFNNYPCLWQEIYNEKNYVLIDPSVHHGLRTTRPLIWHEELFSQSRSFWEEARSYGLKYGWAQSTHNSPGSIGMLTVARSAQEISHKELAKKESMLFWLKQIVHEKLIEKLTPDIFYNRDDLLLTKRESEIIRWTAEGKTSDEISTILSISSRTVNFHLNNTMGKLKVYNKTAAAVRAVQLGII